MSARAVAGLAARLTPRDLWLAHMLHEHRVLTSHAIATMAFADPRRARRRLLHLFEWGVLDRFRPLLQVGTAPMHYVLTDTGTAILAAHHGLPATALRTHDVAALAHSSTLAHTTALGDLAAAHIHTYRATDPAGHAGHLPAAGATVLQHWWSETRCRAHFTHAFPDAYVVLARHSTARTGRRVARFGFALELDLATEPRARLAAKLDRYADLADTLDHTNPAGGDTDRRPTRDPDPRDGSIAVLPVMFWFASPHREDAARATLTQALAEIPDVDDLLRVATTHTPATLTGRGTAIDGPIWLPLTREHSDRTRRRSLTGLAATWPRSILNHPPPPPDNHRGHGPIEFPAPPTQPPPHLPRQP